MGRGRDQPAPSQRTVGTVTAADTGSPQIVTRRRTRASDPGTHRATPGPDGVTRRATPGPDRVTRRGTRPPDSADPAYRGFWERVGREFPELGGAVSTAHYREDEEWLLRRHLPDLAGARLLKTDLWDEAKNTRILCWAAGQGADAWGVDISPPIVGAAREAFTGRGLELRAMVADVRRLPFVDGAFDAVYSMGTVEHFRDPSAGIREIYRVLRPGGRAVIGVPNRHDPFLRPLLVAILYRLGLYGYGYEKSFSRRQLRGMLEAAGFRVEAESGILFLPGWLRMLDLACHSWLRPAARLTGALVRPFTWLSRAFPRLRRHGYLIASVGMRPGNRAL